MYIYKLQRVIFDVLQRCIANCTVDDRTMMNVSKSEISTFQPKRVRLSYRCRKKLTKHKSETSAFIQCELKSHHHHRCKKKKYGNKYSHLNHPRNSQSTTNVTKKRYVFAWFCLFHKILSRSAHTYANNHPIVPSDYQLPLQALWRPRFCGSEWGIVKKIVFLGNSGLRS